MEILFLFYATSCVFQEGPVDETLRDFNNVEILVFCYTDFCTYQEAPVYSFAHLLKFNVHLSSLARKS